MRILTVAVGALSFLACKPRGFNQTDLEGSTPQGTAASRVTPAAPLPSFCNIPSGSGVLWNAAEVQQEIGSLIALPGYKRSALSAYSEAYLAMTYERDKVRCLAQGSMVPDSVLARRLNDALADLMTKGLVMSQRACFGALSNAQAKTKIPTIGAQLCDLSRQALTERWLAIELAMGSTALYLTSLMGLSVSALPHADILWVDTPYATLDQRINAMQQFKPTYDAFNLFLSNNLHTVAKVLLKEKRVDCKLFEVAARAVEITRAPALLFKEMRDKTFVLGVELAKSWPRGLHPFTAGEKTWDVTRTFAPFVKEPDALVALKEHGNASVRLLKNPLLKAFNGENAATYVTFEGLTCDVRK